MTISYTNTELKEEVAKELGDTGLAYGTFTDALITQKVKECLREFSRYYPHHARETVLTNDTREVDISSLENVIRIEKVEYEIDEDPKQFCGFKEIRDGFILLNNNVSTPDADEDVRIYYEKVQTAATLEAGHLELFTRLCAARVILAYDMTIINTVPKGGKSVVSNYRYMGQDKLQEVLSELVKVKKPITKMSYPAR